ncbi:MAG: alpha-E domain-containing protein [Verrucomicrobia bacterium]|nr:alpha-E domain-containing protein [Verrucomicrobiota bacterium]
MANVKIETGRRKTEMLCRVADSLFWLSRYLERSENTCQMVEVHLQVLLDSGQARGITPRDFWNPMLVSLGDEVLFEKLYPEYSHQNVTEFLTFNRDNPSSIFGCVFAARENARMIRDQISPEMFEAINRLYLTLRQTATYSISQSSLYDLFQRIREMIYLINGIIDATIPRMIGYEFMRAGQFLERADKTGRLLDSWAFAPMELSDAENDSYLVAILRSCSALEFYQQEFKTRIIPRNVLQFLMLSRVFPRAIFFSLSELQRAIHAISGCPTTHYSNEVERLCGLLISELNYIVLQDVIDRGIHEFLVTLHSKIEKIALEFSKQYMFFPVVDPANEPDED